MNYEILTVTTADGILQKYVTVYIDEHSAQTFPADIENADYVAFIEANPEALKKVRAS